MSTSANGMQGMDVGFADEYSTKLSGSAGLVQNLLTRTTNMLNSVTWTGPEAQQFHSDWHGSFVPQMNGAIQALQDNATVIKNRAQAQRDISGG